MSNLNRTKTITLAFAGALMSLAALIIFVVLPDSELANGIQYSGKDALWVLTLTPVFSLAGAVNFMYAYLKDYKIWSGVLSKNILIGATAVIGSSMIFNFAVYLSYLISQFRLGFVAPYTGTVYENLVVLLTVFTVHQLIFSALSIPAVKKQ